MKTNLIVATTENGVIGLNGDMPWSMPVDLKHFKNVTTNGEVNIVLMGRKTYDSIGKALPGRQNFVITRNKNKEDTDYIDGMVFNSIQEALDHAQGLENFLKKEHEVHIIGGASIYNETIKMGCVDVIHHTLIHTELKGDTIFDIPSDWGVNSEVSHKADDKNDYDCSMRVLTKDSDLSSSPL